MIGNDIVDLKQATNDSPDSYCYGKRYQRFLDKVFTKEEQQLILNSKKQHQTVWLLWSMKEATYKVNVQQFGKQFFNPKKLVCSLISETSGCVLIGKESYFTNSTITRDYVYTVATLKALKNYKSECFKIKNFSHNYQSETLKKNFLTAISRLKNSSLEKLQIKKNDVGVPKLVIDDFVVETAITFTHHGNFCGYAML